MASKSKLTGASALTLMRNQGDRGRSPLLTLGLSPSIGYVPFLPSLFALNPASRLRDPALARHYEPRSSFTNFLNEREFLCAISGSSLLQISIASLRLQYPDLMHPLRMAIAFTPSAPDVLIRSNIRSLTSTRFRPPIDLIASGSPTSQFSKALFLITTTTLPNPARRYADSKLAEKSPGQATFDSLSRSTTKRSTPLCARIFILDSDAFTTCAAGAYGCMSA